MLAPDNLVVLNLGETCTSNHFVVMKCHGLGSCIALFIFDVASRNSAGAHIMLPGSFDGSRLAPECYALNAIHTLIAFLKASGSEVFNLRAVVIGGGNTTNIPALDIGEKNAASVLDELKKQRIVISRMCVGSNVARTASFCSRSRRVQITKVDPFKKTTL